MRRRIFKIIIVLLLSLFSVLNNKAKALSGVQDLYLVGNATPVGWDINNPIQMTKINGKFTWEGVLQPGYFKFVLELYNWNKCFNAYKPDIYVNTKLKKPLALKYTDIGANDYSFMIPIEGKYKLTVDTETEELFVEYINDTSKTTVFCIGDSITAKGYPGVIQYQLGSDYIVINGGVNERSTMKMRYLPYWNELAYAHVKAVNPDIITISLGTNDSLPANIGFEAERLDEYQRDLIAMINELLALPSKPKIYLMTPCYTYIEHLNGWRGSVIKNYIAPTIRKVAKEYNLDVINFYGLTNYHWEYYDDGIHPYPFASNILGEYATKVLLKRPVLTYPKVINWRPILGVTSYEKVKLKGSNLTKDIKLEMIGEDFSLREISVSKDSLNRIDGYDITIGSTSTTYGLKYGTLKITIPDTEEVISIPVESHVTNLYMLGDATHIGWNLYNSSIQFEPINDKLVWTGNMYEGYFRFFTLLDRWDECFISNVGDDKIRPNVSDTEYEMHFSFGTHALYPFYMPEAGTYTIEVDMKTKKFTVEKVDMSSLWATGSAVNNKIIKLENNPRSLYEEGNNNILRLTGELNRGELILMNTPQITSTTRFLIPTIYESNILGSKPFTISKEKKGWPVVDSDKAYRILLNKESSFLDTDLYRYNGELYLIGSAVSYQWDLEKAISFKRDLETPHLMYVEIELFPGVFSQFKIMGQKSWWGYSLNPYREEEAPIGKISYFRSINSPASILDYQWKTRTIKPGLYRITLNVLNETISCEYLGASKKILKNKIENNAFQVVQEQNTVKLLPFDKVMPYSLECVNINGRVTFKKSKIIGDFFIDSSNKGVYILNVTQNNNTYIKRVIIP